MTHLFRGDSLGFQRCNHQPWTPLPPPTCARSKLCWIRRWALAGAEPKVVPMSNASSEKGRVAGIAGGDFGCWVQVLVLQKGGYAFFSFICVFSMCFMSFELSLSIKLQVLWFQTRIHGSVPKTRCWTLSHQAPQDPSLHLRTPPPNSLVRVDFLLKENHPFYVSLWNHLVTFVVFLVASNSSRKKYAKVKLHHFANKNRGVKIFFGGKKRKKTPPVDHVFGYPSPPPRDPLTLRMILAAPLGPPKNGKPSQPNVLSIYRWSLTGWLWILTTKTKKSSHFSLKTLTQDIFRVFWGYVSKTLQKSAWIAHLLTSKKTIIKLWNYIKKKTLRSNLQYSCSMLSTRNRPFTLRSSLTLPACQEGRCVKRNSAKDLADSHRLHTRTIVYIKICVHKTMYVYIYIYIYVHTAKHDCSMRPLIPACNPSPMAQIWVCWYKRELLGSQTIISKILLSSCHGESSINLRKSILSHLYVYIHIYINVCVCKNQNTTPTYTKCR